MTAPNLWRSHREGWWSMSREGKNKPQDLGVTTVLWIVRSESGVCMQTDKTHAIRLESESGTARACFP
jgi:hypothetical protein